MRPNSISHNQDRKKPFWVHHLWSHGWHTVAFSSFHDRHNAWWWTNGWEELHTPTHKKGMEIADEIGAPALAWLEGNAERDNWFLDVHFWDVHCPYRVPEEWLRRFRGEPYPDFPDVEMVERNLEIYGPRSARDLHHERPPGWAPPHHPAEVRTLEDARLLVDGYDGSLAYVDHWIGRILNVLAEKGVLDDTAVIVSGDHGDSFGEHGQYMDHGIANVAVHNIPMVMRWPDMAGRGTSDALVYNLDLCPTTCELLDLPIPEEWDGKSFAAAVKGEEFAGRPYLVYDHGIYTYSRAVRTADWTLIAMYHPGLYRYDSPFYLHDLAADPGQQFNLYPERRDKFNELAGYMTEWRLEQVRKGGAPDPLEQMVTTGPFIYCTPERMERRLQETGRGELVEELRGRLARIRQDPCRCNYGR